MGTFRITSVALLLSAAPAVGPRTIAPGVFDAPGYEITSTLEGARLVTVLSAEGAITTQYGDSADPARITRQFIVRYRDGALWGIDGEHRTYLYTTAARKLEAATATMRHVMKSTPPHARGTAMPAPAVIRRLAAGTSIAGVPAAGFSIAAAGQKWRVWVATTLPRAPASIRAGLAGLIPVGSASRAALGAFVGYPVVRVELARGSGWTRVLETTSIRSVTMRTADLAAPAGFTEVRPPADSTRTRPGGFDVPANVIRGPGPEMGHPELYVVLWGQKLNDSTTRAGQGAVLAAINEMVKPAYTTWLGDYQSHEQRLLGVYRRSDLPPRAVGSSNFAAISAMVYDVGFKERAPIFWWEVGGHDPLYVLLVASSEVDTGGWDGYHFVAFSLTHAVLPFPASLFAHDAIPWTLSKIPDAGLGLPIEGLLRRNACTRPGPRPPAIAAACAALPGLDQGTQSISHEIVEAVSDPYVFLGWSDPGQQPFYEKSEISDICEFNPAPWGSATVVGLSSVATYWSNSARACVPESRPTLTVFTPAVNEVIPSANGNVVLHGYASDPGAGDISDRIRWVVDGVSKGTGPTVNSGILAAGVHQMEASVANFASPALSTTVQRTFIVKMNPATVAISSPVEGGTYAANRQLVFRGMGFSYQPGDVPDNALQWDDGGTVIGHGPVLFLPIAATGDHVIRLSIVDGAGAAQASAQVTVHVVSGGKARPSVMITGPAGGAVIPVAYGAATSAPVQFSALVTDGAGQPAGGTISWVSDVDGPLGSGPALTRALRGGYCAPTTHHITAMVGRGRADRASDEIVLTVGQVC
jgi:hypothetical protein